MSRFVAHAIAGSAHRRGWLDIPKGLRMLRDREVPVRHKLKALAVGVALTVLLELLEMPLEAIVGVLLPFIGPVVDVVIDGAEFLILPIVFAATVLPHLQRRSVQAPPRLVR